MRIYEIFESIIKLNKKVAELSYKANYMEKLGQDVSEIKEEIEDLKEHRAKMLEELKKYNLEFYLPYEEELKKFNEKLKQYNLEQVNYAIKRKEGAVWDILKARASIIKNNLLHATTIGKLAELMLMLNEDKRNKLISYIRKGEIKEDIEVEEEIGLKMAKYLHRIGIQAKYENGLITNKAFPFKEVGIKIEDKTIYVPEQSVEEVMENEQKLKDISVKIQVKNAEKQIKKFSEAEIKEFENMQKEYLALLKKREEYLKKFGED